MIPLWGIPIATVTGNKIVIKPSERCPGAALIIAELAKEAGFPKGVINIIHGTSKAVNFILDEPRIKAVSFVGSTSGGEYVYMRASANGKGCMANLGAKNHAVLLPDCDRHAAENAIVGTAFGAAGQRCMALSTFVTLPERETWVESLAPKLERFELMEDMSLMLMLALSSHPKANPELSGSSIVPNKKGHALFSMGGVTNPPTIRTATA